MTLADVFAARTRIAPYLRRTSLVESAWLSDAAGAHVLLKLESQQLSNSFKSRGAFNAVLARLERSTPPAKIVTASAGNHGRALAAAAETFRLPLVVFTPIDAPRTKVAAITRHGAELRSEGRDYDDAERRALAFARDTGAEFISPYNDADVIAGAGTIALELAEDAPDLDAIVVPIGGGGLISGIATAVKAIAPRCEIIGVEAEASCAFLTSVRAGRLVEIVPGPTLADGLGGNPDPETITFAFVQKLVDRIVTVSEADLAAAIVGLVESEHLVAEGAGAAAVAALVRKRADVTGRRVAALITGSNIDRARLAKLLG
ncbi:MAG TPA: pyridoxal-phosphate dependent enzyme [Vicinamibacterales bacterium]|nr:pyridoxal-phosphate dependent enzyme [Vicinamibacterales bacterium]